MAKTEVWSAGFGFLKDMGAVSSTGCLAIGKTPNDSPQWSLLTPRGPVITGDNAKKAPSAGLDTQ